jgi:outer membrane lipoprotein-sorting protein
MVSFRSHLAPGIHRFRSRRGHLTALLLALALPTGVLPAGEAADPVLSAWLDAHRKLETWSADLVQTRHLAALAQPLISTGMVYYAQPGLFRWELGQPPETIAIRSTHDLLLLYPGLHRAERYPIDQGKGGPLRDALTLMEAGFPKNEASLRAQYNIATDTGTNNQSRVVLEPRASAARRLVRRVTLTFQTNVFSLAATSIEFADGSKLENVFTTRLSNEPLPPQLFATNLPPDWKLVEPFKP